jgi:hypothetical protein
MSSGRDEQSQLSEDSEQSEQLQPPAPCEGALRSGVDRSWCDAVVVPGQLPAWFVEPRWPDVRGARGALVVPVVSPPVGPKAPTGVRRRARADRRVAW